METSNEDWKKDLRVQIISAMNVTVENASQLYEQIGRYYMCYTPRFLYKYYRADQRTLDAIRNNKMWYSAPSSFNDVFDCDITIDENILFDGIIKSNPDTRNIRKGSTVWHDLRQSCIREIGKLKSVFDQMKDTTGISCLSEEDDSLLMWAHYAGNHCGMCVEYELLEINQALGFTPVPVVYSDEKINLHIDDMERTERIIVESVTTKSPEWSYEKEWRIIRDEAACGERWNAEKKGALLDMISPSAIILGCMASPEFSEEVQTYCEQNRIKLYKMQKSKIKYCLEKIPILQFDN